MRIWIILRFGSKWINFHWISRKPILWYLHKEKQSHWCCYRYWRQCHCWSKPNEFLGVDIDNKFTWKKHIHYIAGKLSRGIGLVAKARKLLKSDALITLYYSFIYPYLCYCNHVWGSTYVSNLQKLILLQKRIIRMIMGAKPRDHTEPMFVKLGLLKFVDINKYLIAVFMHRNHIARTPVLMCLLITLKGYKMFIIMQHEAVVGCMPCKLKLILAKHVFSI